MALSPTPRCSLCNTTAQPPSSLSRCAACKVTFYCSREHQTLDRTTHKRPCTAIKTAQGSLGLEEMGLRNLSSSFGVPDNLFEEHAGHFWGITETRPYMRFRYALVEALLKIDTYTAVSAAHDHLMDMLRLCRGDNLGVRSLVPPIKLRLGKDQECYDFCLWWARNQQDSRYDWGDLDAPYLDIKDADVFKRAAEFQGRWTDLSHASSITLLKIRLYLDLRMLQTSATDQALGKLPGELESEVKELALTSSILAQKPPLPFREDRQALIDNLEDEIKKLYKAVNSSNQHYWQGLVDGKEEDLNARPQMYGFGDKAQMQLMLGYTWKAWVETPGAREYVKDLHQKMQQER